MSIKNIFQSFLPHIAPVPLAEKIRSGLVAGISISLLALALKYLPQNTYPLMMLGSMAASALLVFAIPHSPLAQPWNLVGGHLISAMAGWLCILFIPDPILAAGVGVGAAIFLMHFLNCLHPPGAATALILTLNSAQFQNMGFKAVMCVVLINVAVSLLLALLINNLIPGRKYPIQHATQALAKPAMMISLEQQDLELALVQMGSVIDISEDDLAQIYEFALRNAQERTKK
jgi:CBS domain-containing membrane protein